MLEEDLDKERFFALVRRTYWESPDELAAPRADADAHRQAGFLTRPRLIVIDYKRPASTSTPATRRSGASSRWRAATFTPGVLSEIGSFGGLFRLDRERYQEPVLVSSADGVGTKLKVAFMTGRHDTVGADLVNHCVNDILVQGAEPLFFLDYLATGRLSPEVAEQVVTGVARACRENGCALIGGETAEMPGFYADGEYDIAGFIVGVVEQVEGRSTDAAIVPGDVLIGLPSAGLHTNGYSLARRVFFETAGWTPDTFVPRARHDGRRRAARAAPVVSARWCGRCSSADWSRGWRTSPAAASPRTCRGCCRRAAPPRSICSAWTVPPLFRLLQQHGAHRRATRCSARSTWAIGLVVVCARARRRARHRHARAGRRAERVSASARRRRRPDGPLRLSDAVNRRLGVLISGRGSNLQSIIDAIAGRRARRDDRRRHLEPRRGAGPAARARRRHRGAAPRARATIADRDAYDRALVEALRDARRRAGLPRRLHAAGRPAAARRVSRTASSTSTRRCCRRFPASTRSAGARARRARDRRDRPPRDAGARRRSDRAAGRGARCCDDDTVETLAARILVEEHRLYPEAIAHRARRRLAIDGRRFVRTAVS